MPAACSSSSCNPVPNYFFQRDPQVVMGNRVVVSSMATDAREREPLLARTLFEHHPALAGSRGALRDRRPALRRAAAQPALPLSEPRGRRRAGGQPGDRPRRRSPSAPTGAASRSLAEYLRLEETSFRHLIMVELPREALLHAPRHRLHPDRPQPLPRPPAGDRARRPGVGARLLGRPLRQGADLHPAPVAARGCWPTSEWSWRWSPAAAPRRRSTSSASSGPTAPTPSPSLPG